MASSIDVAGGGMTPNAISFNVDPITGAIMIIIAIASGMAIIGFRFLASGLADSSVRVLITAVSYTGIWTMLSLLAVPLLNGIEIFGVLIYVALSLLYVIGVIEKISGV